MSFQQPAIAVIYIIANLLLGTHLSHGMYSMFQSLGVGQPRFSAAFRRFADIFSVLVVAGFISIPIAVMAGYGS